MARGFGWFSSLSSINSDYSIKLVVFQVLLAENLTDHDDHWSDKTFAHNYYREGVFYEEKDKGHSTKCVFHPVDYIWLCYDNVGDSSRDCLETQSNNSTNLRWKNYGTHR